MKIQSLKLYDGLFYGEYDFSDTTVIYSQHNKAGKTTLLRCILYALGYQIPSTRGISFERMKFEVNVKLANGKEVLLRRHGAIIVLYDSKNEQRFSLPYDQTLLLTELFAINEPLVVDNVLGAFYFDQEKGWTLLNRGKVIGNIRFNIEDFLRGLTGKSCINEKLELDAVQRKLRQYRQMLGVAKYQIELDSSGDTMPFETPTEEISQEIRRLENEKKPLENELTRLQNVLRKTTSFKNYISGMRLRVRSESGEEIPVTADTIVDFKDHEQLLRAKREEVSYRIVQIDNKLGKLNERMSNTQVLVEVETTIEHFAAELARVRVDKASVERIIAQLDKKRIELTKRIQSVVSRGSEVVKEMTEAVIEYLKYLGVDERYGYDIFTHDLKSLTGATFHLLVFAFKLSYVKMIFKKTGCVLPIIIDSPHGREVERSFVDKMMALLTRDFSSHQVIIATIYNPELPAQSTITLEQDIMKLMNVAGNA